MQRFDKYTVQTLGFALIVIGIFLFILSLIAGPYRYSGPPCAYPGCPPSVLPWYWWLPSASFFSGIGLTIAVIILLIVARSMKPKQKTDAAIKQAPADA
jgi:hypothetical protein